MAGKAYCAAVAEADGYVGEVLDMVTSQSARGSTYVLVTSDHGGTRKGHGKNSLAEIQIPWMLAGPGVVAGQIDDVVNTYDTAATLAWIFDLEPPQCWTGRAVLAAFGRAATVSTANRRPQRGCVPETTDAMQLASHSVETRTAPPAKGRQ